MLEVYLKALRKTIAIRYSSAPESRTTEFDHVSFVWKLYSWTNCYARKQRNRSIFNCQFCSQRLADVSGLNEYILDKSFIQKNVHSKVTYLSQHLKLCHSDTVMHVVAIKLPNPLLNMLLPLLNFIAYWAFSKLFRHL